MNHTLIRKKQEDVNNLLNRKRLYESISMLRELARETQKGELIDTLYNIEMTYKSLLRFTVEGFTDPERQKIYNHILADIFGVADEIFMQLFIRYGQGVFFDLMRQHAGIGRESLESILVQCRTEMDRTELMESVPVPHSEVFNSAFRQLFEITLTQKGLYKENEDIIINCFRESSLPWAQQCVLVSAVTIHLLHFFNEDAMLLLFRLTSHSNAEIRQRALVGLYLVLFKYDKRISLYPEVTRQIQKLRQGNVKQEVLRGIIIQLLRTLDTEKLARKLTDEILPEVARIHPNLRDRLDLDNIIEEGFKEGKNPDWQDILSEKPELMDKLEEMSRLQMEGADLFISTFRMLKHFPFFNRLENWFMPFVWPNPIAEDVLKYETGAFRNSDLLEGMATSGIICNSDKYSFIFSIPQMPATQKEMMGQMFMSELSALKEVEQSDSLVDTAKKELTISNLYIQDLYRFFKLLPQRGSFEDPFAWSLDFHNCEFVHQLLPDEDFYMKLGEYLFDKDRFQEALEVYGFLSRNTTPNMQLLQKQAYCCQQLGRYEQALELYLQAQLFQHDQVWNLKKIALCYHYLKNPEKALEYYLEAEKVQPDNLHTMVSIGHCLLELKNYEEALKYYFKVEYLDPGNKKVGRPIVWCALSLGKFDQAEKYSQKILDENPTRHDYMNMGHIHWCRGDRQAALHYYKQSITFQGNSMEAFIESFNNDIELLKKHNVDEADIPIMLDQLRYHLE